MVALKHLHHNNPLCSLFYVLCSRLTVEGGCGIVCGL